MLSAHFGSKSPNDQIREIVAIFAIYPVGDAEAADAESRITTLARAGHAGAERVFDKRFHGPLVGYVYNLSQCPDIAQDTAQETKVKALDPDTSWAELGQTWPWLKTIARHKYFDVRRKKQPETGDAFDRAEQRTAKSANMDAEEQRILLSVVVVKLPEQERLVIEMRFLEGRTLEEVSEMLNLSTSVVYRIQKSGLKRLKLLLSR